MTTTRLDQNNNQNGDEESGSSSVTSHTLSSNNVISLALANGTTTTRPDSSLQTLVDELKTELGNLPNFPEPANFTQLFAPYDVKKLIELFLNLSNASTTEYNYNQHVALSKCKLLIMRIASSQLPVMYRPEIPEPAQYWQIAMVVISVFLGVLYSGAESFTGSYDLLNRLFSMAEPTSFGISIVFALFSNLLFFALEARGFMTEFGISTPDNFYKFLQVTNDKLEVAKTFSRSMRDTPITDIQNAQHFKDNYALLKLFQDDIRKDWQATQPVGSATSGWNTFLTVSKHVLSLFGAGLFALGGIIIAKDFIANIAALSFGVVLSTPAANIIFATLALAGFVMYYALQNNGVFNLFDALIGRPHDLSKQQKAFDDDTRAVNEHIKEKIQILELRDQGISLPEPASPIRRPDPERDPTVIRRVLPTNGVHANGAQTNGFHTNSPHRFLPSVTRPPVDDSSTPTPSIIRRHSVS